MENLEEIKKDLFGYALYQFFKGDRSEFGFEIVGGDYFVHDLGKYFRSYKEYTNIEKMIIERATGNILDVGAGTGMYISSLSQKGKTYGIELSNYAVKIAREKQINNLIVGDIFTYETNESYDVITLIENNIGLAGIFENVKTLLEKLVSLMNYDGKILTNISKDIKEGEYREVELIPVLGELKGESIKWINLSYSAIECVCKSIGLKSNIILEDSNELLIEIMR